MNRRRSRRGPSPTAARIALFCLVALTAAVRADDAARPLFRSDAPLEVVLEAPWQALIRHKDAKRRYPAVVAVADGAGRVQRVQAMVEARGLTRLRVCRLPPLRIRFARDAAAGTGFAGQRSLKMVTHCRSGAAHEQYYVQEWLAYRIHQLVTRDGFRVRPLSVTYRDMPDGGEDGPHFAFLLESLGELASRTGRTRSKQVRFVPGDFEPVAMTRFMLFQYLIGNTDFDVTSGPREDACCHNVRVLAPAQGTGLVALPYDFDSAGMIDASYAAPHQRLPIRSVTQRLYRGFCLHNDALAPVRAEFLAHRDAILALVRSEVRLDDRHRRDTIRYLEAFFATLGSDERFARDISGKCRR